MAKPIQVVIAAAALLAAAGCQPNTDQHARNLVEPESFAGSVMLPMAFAGEQPPHESRADVIRSVTMPDGAVIDAWVVSARVDTAEAARGTVVLLHPLLCSKIWFLGLAEELAGRGFDAATVDLRAHGRSGGKFFTWGAKEKHDVKAVVDSLLADGSISEPLYVCGASAGGCVAAQYAAIDPRCRGALLLAAPAGFRKIARRIMMLRTNAEYTAAVARAAELARFDPDDADAVAAAAQFAGSVRVVHGMLDLVVPYEHSREIFEAAPGPKKMVPQFFHGHAPEIGRNQWVADEIEALTTMK